jgi:hypothetical protein
MNLSDADCDTILAEIAHLTRMSRRAWPPPLPGTHSSDHGNGVCPCEHTGFDYLGHDYAHHDAEYTAAAQWSRENQ